MKKGIKKYFFYSVFIHLFLIAALLISLAELGYLSFDDENKSELTHVSVYKNSVKINKTESSEKERRSTHLQVASRQRDKDVFKSSKLIPTKKEALNSKNQYKITKNSSNISKEETKKESSLLQHDSGSKLKNEIVKGGNENNEAEPVKSSAKPEYGKNRKPEYPLVARRRGYEGEVVFNVQVLDDGKVGNLEIVKTSGYSVLDNSALDALRKWKFVPGKYNGKFVPSWVKVPIQFRLNDT